MNSNARDLFDSFLCVLAPWRLCDKWNLNLLDFVGHPTVATQTRHFKTCTSVADGAEMESFLLVVGEAPNRSLPKKNIFTKIDIAF